MVKGLKQFMSTFSTQPRVNIKMIKEVKEFIRKSKCPSIRFEDLDPRIAGISKPDECVISTIVLQFPLEYFLYMILHEISHQYQYTKYGKDLVLDVYTTLDLDEATDRLLEIESIADRLALLKMKSIFKSCDIPLYVVPNPRYLNMEDKTYMRNYVQTIKSDVIKYELSSIEEINNHIYKINSID